MEIAVFYGIVAALGREVLIFPKNRSAVLLEEAQERDGSSQSKWRQGNGD
jgi:hypothetical protein